jgi:hypothetical protein
VYGERQSTTRFLAAPFVSSPFQRVEDERRYEEQYPRFQELPHEIVGQKGLKSWASTRIEYAEDQAGDEPGHQGISPDEANLSIRADSLPSLWRDLTIHTDPI